MVVARRARRARTDGARSPSGARSTCPSPAEQRDAVERAALAGRARPPTLRPTPSTRGRAALPARRRGGRRHRPRAGRRGPTPPDAAAAPAAALPRARPRRPRRPRRAHRARSRRGTTSCCPRARSSCCATSPGTSATAPRSTSDWGFAGPSRPRARGHRAVRRRERHRQDAGGRGARRRARARPVPHRPLGDRVSKYIGETEKNLRRLFDAAEASGAVLLFDEADALFGKRGEVKDAHDRYANLEVAYLLQRMESYRGLAILTTNLRSNVDRAFLRRLRFVVQFPFPDRAQRAEIWRRMFPAARRSTASTPTRWPRLHVRGGSIRVDRPVRGVRRRRGRHAASRPPRAAGRAGRVREGGADAHRRRDGGAAMTPAIAARVVDELVFRGVPPGGADAVAAALELRLEALGERWARQRTSRPRRRRAVPAPAPVAAPADLGRSRVGEAVADAVWDAVGTEATTVSGETAPKRPARAQAGARPSRGRTNAHEREADAPPTWSRAAAASPAGRSPRCRSRRRRRCSGRTTARPKSDEEKQKEALIKAGEAALETTQGKALKEKVLADPLVKTVKDAITSPGGLVATGAVAAGGVAALAATGKELPFQPPAIPLDKITPGLSAKVTYEGPVNAPTFVGLTITYKEQGPKARGAKKSGSQQYREDTARLAAEQEPFGAASPMRPAARRPRSSGSPTRRSAAGSDCVGAGGHSGPRRSRCTPAGTAKKEEEPVQRAPASSPTAGSRRTPRSTARSRPPGRPLDPPTRRSMEARFGYDFSAVRVHDDARAASTAGADRRRGVHGRQRLVFGAGRYDPAGPAGRHLLAHELAHVVQQGRGGAGRIQRQGPAATTAVPAERRDYEEFVDTAISYLDSARDFYRAQADAARAGAAPRATGRPAAGRSTGRGRPPSRPRRPGPRLVRRLPRPRRPSPPRRPRRPRRVCPRNASIPCSKGSCAPTRARDRSSTRSSARRSPALTAFGPPTSAPSRPRAPPRRAQGGSTSSSSPLRRRTTTSSSPTRPPTRGSTSRRPAAGDTVQMREAIASPDELFDAIETTESDRMIRRIDIFCHGTIEPTHQIRFGPAWFRIDQIEAAAAARARAGRTVQSQTRFDGSTVIELHACRLGASVERSGRNGYGGHARRGLPAWVRRVAGRFARPAGGRLRAAVGAAPVRDPRRELDRATSEPVVAGPWPSTGGRCRSSTPPWRAGSRSSRSSPTPSGPAPR